MAYHNININPDRQTALEESKRFLDAYYGPVFTPEMVASWTAAGTPQQCVAHLRDLAREGAQAITLRITGWDQKGQYQRMVNEVLGPLAPDPSWLVNSALAMPVIAVFVTWKQLGFFVLLYLAALQNVPKELYESAATEGASRFR